MGKFDTIKEKIKNSFKDFAEQATERYKTAQTKKDELLDNLEKEKKKYIDKTVGSNVSTDLSRVSDDELKLIADRFYEKEITNKKNEAKKEYNSKIYSADKTLQNKQENLNEKLKNIGDKLAKNINSLKEKNFKNNVARSSISSEGEKFLKSDADKNSQLLYDELENAKSQRDKKIENAKEQLENQNYNIEYDYAKPIADKQNELQELKDKNSSYAQSLINRRALKEYDDKILSLVEGYIQEVGDTFAKQLLQKEGYLNNYLSKEQLKELEKKYGWEIK